MYSLNNLIRTYLMLAKAMAISDRKQALYYLNKAKLLKALDNEDKTTTLMTDVVYLKAA